MFQTCFGPVSRFCKITHWLFADIQPGMLYDGRPLLLLYLKENAGGSFCSCTALQWKISPVALGLPGPGTFTAEGRPSGAGEDLDGEDSTGGWVYGLTVLSVPGYCCVTFLSRATAVSRFCPVVLLCHEFRGGGK